MLNSLTLLSVPFILLSFLAVLFLNLFDGKSRQYVFLLLNVFFIWKLVLGPSGLLSTVIFCLIGFGIATYVRDASGWLFSAVLSSYVLLFIYMRNYSFLAIVFPESALTTKLATVGLSFLLFKIVHIVIEARSGTLRKLEFLTFLNYCLSFTTFMMGPIQRYDDYYDQWYCRNSNTYRSFEDNLDFVIRVLIGFVKASILASFFRHFTISSGVDFDDLSRGDILLGIYSFNIFLYLSFSGYCDIVIGVGGLMGIKPPENFNKPFIARNISEFWQRQHRSLTLWLTDYVFSPVFKKLLSVGCFSSRPLAAMNFSLMATMLVSGLWHGSTFAFLLFGAAHGILQVIYRTWDTIISKAYGKKRVRKWRKKWSYQTIGIFITFNSVSFTFIFFYLSWQESLMLLAKLLGL